MPRPKKKKSKIIKQSKKDITTQETDKGPKTKAWLQRKNETNKNHHAFMLYLQQDRNNRSIKNVADILMKSNNKYKNHHSCVCTLLQWSDKHDWVPRVSDYDMEILKLAMPSIEAKRIEMTTRHLEQTAQQQKHLMLHSDAIDIKLKTDPKSLKQLATSYPLDVLLDSVRANAHPLSKVREDERKTLGLDQDKGKGDTNVNVGIRLEEYKLKLQNIDKAMENEEEYD